jgi:hypothetical protein
MKARLLQVMMLWTAAVCAALQAALSMDSGKDSDWAAAAVLAALAVVNSWVRHARVP